MGNIIDYGFGETAGDAYRIVDDPVYATEDAISDHVVRSVSDWSADQLEQISPSATLTPNEQITESMYEAFDTNEDEMLSWSEWQDFIRIQGGSHTIRDENFWISERMDFNFIDFNMDEKISKPEYKYYLDNFNVLNSAHSLTIIHESPALPSKMDPMVGILAVLNLGVVAFAIRHVFMNKKRDDSYKNEMSILV